MAIKCVYLVLDFFTEEIKASYSSYKKAINHNQFMICELKELKENSYILATIEYPHGVYLKIIRLKIS